MVKPKNDERLKIAAQRLNYDLMSGKFVYKKTPNVSKKCWNKIAGTPDNRGYLRVSVNKKLVKLHRLAWYMAWGETPPDVIDHLNGIKSDNRICNLMELDDAKNTLKGHFERGNKTSNYKNIWFNKSKNKFEAAFRLKGSRKLIWVGRSNCQHKLKEKLDLKMKDYLVSC